MQTSFKLSNLHREPDMDAPYMEYLNAVNNNPITHIEKRLFRLRMRHTATSHVSLMNTHNVIYAIYGINKNKNSPIYVGKTSRTAFIRSQEEIKTAGDPKSCTPISKYIRVLGRYKTGVYILQVVENPDFLDYYERKWIHRLETHIHKNNKPAMNVNWEQQLLIHKKRNRNRGNHNTPVVKDVAKQLHTVLHIAKFPNIKNEPPTSTINGLNLATLYKIMSITTGKVIKHRPCEVSKEEENKYINTHRILRSSTSKEIIDIITTYITEAIFRVIEKIKSTGHKTKKAFPRVQILTLVNLGQYNKIIKISETINKYKHLIGEKTPYMEQPKVVYKNLPNNGRIMFNHKKAAMEMVNKNTYKSINCKCLLLKNDTFKKEEHINTGNINVLEFILNNRPYKEETIELMKKGVKFIQRPNLNKNKIIEIYRDSIFKHKEKLDKFTKNPTKNNTWAKAVSDDIALKINNASIKFNTEEAHKRKQIINNIKFIHKTYVITCIDKLPNNFCIICKKHWMKVLYSTTINKKQKTYEKVFSTEEKIIEQHKVFLNSQKFKITPALPIKYITSKQHKEGWRPITAVPATTTTHLSKTLVKVLDLIIKTVKMEAFKTKLITGINTFFDIENAKDVKDKIEEMNNNKHHKPLLLETSDITGWYDNINHLDLMEKIKYIINHTYNEKRRKYILVKKGIATWTNSKEPTTYYIHCLKAKKLIKLIEWRLNNQIIKVGQIIVRQILGTGQGDNHSGHLCRLLSITYEKIFMEYLIKHNIELANKFTNTLRKHDDYVFFNNPNISPYLKQNGKIPGLMPVYFELKSTSQDIEESNYLDTNIHIIQNPFKNKPDVKTDLENKKLPELKTLASELKLKNTGNKKSLINRILQFKKPYNNYHNKEKIWNIKTYNKKDEFKLNFRINSFPKYKTNLPLHCKTEVVIGQLHSLTTTNAHYMGDFIANVIKLYKHLTVHNGYPGKKLDYLFKSFIYNNKHYPYHASAKTLIKMYYNSKYKTS